MRTTLFWVKSIKKQLFYGENSGNLLTKKFIAPRIEEDKCI
jgi:hypothetical protein